MQLPTCTSRICHRDIKLENVMLEKQNSCTTVKLADFGLATKFSTAKPMRRLCGTPDYLAPEILALSSSSILARKRGSTYGPKVDVWCTAIVMYMILSASAPFVGNAVSELYRSIQRDNVNFSDDFWQHISAEAKDLMSSMLQKDEKLRCSAQEALRHPWFSIAINGHAPSNAMVAASLLPLSKISISGIDTTERLRLKHQQKRGLLM